MHCQHPISDYRYTHHTPHTNPFFTGSKSCQQIMPHHVTKFNTPPSLIIMIILLLCPHSHQSTEHNHHYMLHQHQHVTNTTTNHQILHNHYAPPPTTHTTHTIHSSSLLRQIKWAIVTNTTQTQVSSEISTTLHPYDHHTHTHHHHTTFYHRKITGT